MQSQQMEVIDGVLETMGYPNCGTASAAIIDMTPVGAAAADQVAQGSGRTLTYGCATETAYGEGITHAPAFVPSTVVLGCAIEFPASELRWTPFSTYKRWEWSRHLAHTSRFDAIKLDAEPKLRAKKRASDFNHRYPEDS